jgi:hypothetical protein
MSKRRKEIYRKKMQQRKITLFDHVDTNQRQPYSRKDNSNENNKHLVLSSTKKIADLSRAGQYVLALCSLANFIGTAKADELHDKWQGALFVTTDNSINFGIQFDPRTYPNVDNITREILQSCGSLMQLVQPDWWNDVSIDWLSLKKYCNDGIYKTQSEAFMTLSQDILDEILDISIPDSVWQCLDSVLEPKCKTDFFVDWDLGTKIGFITVCAAGLITVSACAFAGYKYLSNIWSQRSGYDSIPERTINDDSASREGMGVTPTLYNRL